MEGKGKRKDRKRWDFGTLRNENMSSFFEFSQIVDVFTFEISFCRFEIL
jgi:polynucleotide 5'-kinase involved in rRNA processing